VTVRERLRGAIRAGEPARDLPFVDACAVVVALFLAYGARAATSPNYPFEWDGVAPFVQVALPVSLCALLLSAAALGLYGPRAVEAGVREHVAAAAYATAIAATVGIYWGGAVPPTAPLVLTGGVCLAACLHGGRLLYRRVGGAERAADQPRGA
jgi:hypothetical protein